MIDTLNTRITAMENDPRLLGSFETAPNAHEAASLAATNEALRRENALIVSAWYDLTSRLQSSQVTVSRHRTNAEAPRSFIGRQRRAVEGVMIGKMQA